MGKCERCGKGGGGISASSSVVVALLLNLYPVWVASCGPRAGCTPTSNMQHKAVHRVTAMYKRVGQSLGAWLRQVGRGMEGGGRRDTGAGQCGWPSGDCMHSVCEGLPACSPLVDTYSPPTTFPVQTAPPPSSPFLVRSLDPSTLNLLLRGAVRWLDAELGGWLSEAVVTG